MKKLLTLTFSAFIAMSAHAQTDSLYKLYHSQILNGLMQLQEKNTGANEKTTGMKERLIATSRYEAATLTSLKRKEDSAMFTYSGNHGSSYNFSNMAYQYFYLPTQSYYPPMYLNTTSPNDVGEILYDSLSFKYYRADTAYYDVKISRQYTGDLAMKVSEIDNDTNSYWHALNYNAYGNILTDAYIIARIPHNDTVEIRRFAYDAAQHLVADSAVQDVSGSRITVDKDVYSYNAKGNLSEIQLYLPAAGGWQIIQRFSLGYTIDNKLETLLMDTGASLSHYQLDSFGYLTAVNYYTFTSDSMWNGKNWSFNSSMQKYINAAGVPDSLVHLFYDTAPAKEKHVYTYTAANNPLTDIDYVSTSGSFIIFTNYYYESYTAVPEIAKPTAKVLLYPNPVADELNLQITGNIKTGRLVLDVFNANGQLLKSANFSGINSVVRLPLAELPAGIYVYRLAQDGQIMGSGSFLKK